MPTICTFVLHRIPGNAPLWPIGNKRMSTALKLVQEQEGGRLIERSIAQRKLYPFDKLRTELGQNDDLVRAAISAANPGFSAAHLTRAITMVINPTGLGLGITAGSSTGYYQLLMPDGSVGPVRTSGSSYSVSITSGASFNRFLGIAPCNVNGSPSQAPEARASCSQVARVVYADLSNAPAGGDYVTDNSLLRGIINPQDAALSSGMVQYKLSGAGVTQVKLSTVSTYMTFHDLSGCSNLRWLDCNGGTFKLFTAQYNLSYATYYTLLHLANCALTTDSLYFLLDTMAPAESEYPDVSVGINVTGNPCLGMHGGALNGEHYTAAQVYALAVAKNVTLVTG